MAPKEPQSLPLQPGTVITRKENEQELAAVGVDPFSAQFMSGAARLLAQGGAVFGSVDEKGDIIVEDIMPIIS